MSSLCSAHFGKNLFRLSTRKVPKKPPAPAPCVYEEIPAVKQTPKPPAIPPREKLTKSSDEIYGFLPGHDLGSTMSLTRSCLSLASSRHSVKPCSVLSSGHSSGHSSGYSSESAESTGSSPSGCESSPPSTRSTSSRYPRSQLEVASSLASATMSDPANIPLLVAREHISPDEWTGRNEISVHPGMVVNALFKSFDWVYVRTAEDREGYIPLFCVKPIGRSVNEETDFCQQYPENSPLNTSSGNSSMTSSTSSLCSEESIVLSMEGRVRYDPDMSILEGMPARHRSPVLLFNYPELDFLGSTTTLNTEDDEDTQSVTSSTSSMFSRCEGAQLSILFDYNAMDQDDISVRRQETVTLLNDEDPDWIWVMTAEGREGFIPKSYAADLQSLHLDPSVKTTYF